MRDAASEAAHGLQAPGVAQGFDLLPQGLAAFGHTPLQRPIGLFQVPLRLPDGRQKLRVLEAQTKCFGEREMIDASNEEQPGTVQQHYDGHRAVERVTKSSDAPEQCEQGRAGKRHERGQVTRQAPRSGGAHPAREEDDHELRGRICSIEQCCARATPQDPARAGAPRRTPSPAFRIRRAGCRESIAPDKPQSGPRHQQRQPHPAQQQPVVAGTPCKRAHDGGVDAIRDQHDERLAVQSPHLVGENVRLDHGPRV